MNALVLGSEGLIGSHLCDRLYSEGYHVIRIDKRFAGDFYDPSMDLYNADIVPRLAGFFSKVDFVFFLAAEIGGSKFMDSANSEFGFLDENVRIITNVFRAYNLAFPKPKMLFSSSQMSNMDWSTYGMSKKLGEVYASLFPGVDVCRFWNVYGPERIGERSHVVPDFIDQAKRGSVVMQTDGGESRQFLHVDDCVDALVSWMNGEFVGLVGSLDITSFEWTKIRNLATKIASIYGAEVKVGVKKDSVQHDSRNEPNKEVLKFWKPKISLIDGVRKVAGRMR